MGKKALPKIYLYCVATHSGSGIVSGSTRGGDVAGFALAEDGEGLCSHYSSSVGFAKHDLGLNSNWKHDFYDEHYPDGYELEWIDEKDLESHQGFQAALAENRKKHPIEPEAANG